VGSGRLLTSGSVPILCGPSALAGLRKHWGRTLTCVLSQHWAQGDIICPVSLHQAVSSLEARAHFSGFHPQGLACSASNTYQTDGQIMGHGMECQVDFLLPHTASVSPGQTRPW
jgi:hypothetical protein